MRNATAALTILVSALCAQASAQQNNSLAALRPAGADVLWYNSPAEKWEKQALPIGNGRLGGMVFGGIDQERIQFNEDSLWIGDEKDTGAYQNFGDLYIDLDSAKDSQANKRGKTRAAPRAYWRALNIGKAVHEVAYRQGGTTYRRTYFASYPAQVMAFRLTADQPGAYSGTVRLVDAHRGKVVATNSRICMTGSLDGYVYGGGSSRGRKQTYSLFLDYEAQLLVLHDGGTVTCTEDAIRFDKCDALTLLLAADTNYANRREAGWKTDHPHNRLTAQLDAAARRSFAELRAEHTADYQTLFKRMQLDVGLTPADTRRLPTDQRLAAYRESAQDPQLETLLFQFARYLMISSSRHGAMPANLQGLWNHSNKPPWRSDYHTDVNVEMNYWFVDAANLSDCFSPLAEWVNSIRAVRRAETHDALSKNGWITHAENGIFGGSTWKWSKGDAAWVAQNLWDHYAFTMDREYLETRVYPVLKESCQFWIDDLKALPDGRLVSPNGFSPEHGPQEDGVSFDQQLVWDLFTNYIDAATALEKDPEMCQQIRGLRDRLLGPQIGRWGQLQEWMVDRDDPKDQHRHLSHMIAVHPSRQISPLTTPKLAEAARVSMTARGDKSTGWSRAWKISIWARLHDGNHAYRILSSMLQDMIHDNLFNTHPPFQIDGNFGYAAGVCEMILQSHMGVVHFLPALPDAWPNGNATGIRARGGLEVTMQWRDGKATRVILTAARDGQFRLRAPNGQQIAGATTVKLHAGEPYEVHFQNDTQ